MQKDLGVLRDQRRYPCGNERERESVIMLSPKTKMSTQRLFVSVKVVTLNPCREIQFVLISIFLNNPPPAFNCWIFAPSL